ncbi:hypothetical protein AG1IA_02370 [Rhizoctonia solani AG-1 IA]|uniref:Uncharacterized protein n=1 Tax=Thanatephorus cucumeris (strain AG1-IA) TaxID=983506 RepID=L8X3I9_THACA|nr:hypothetical protein AG1IA_02370 [Rhizoctonia solani AG-1 IA]
MRTKANCSQTELSYAKRKETKKYNRQKRRQAWETVKKSGRADKTRYGCHKGDTTRGRKN